MTEIKTMLCDAGTLIALTETCHCDLLRFFKKKKVNFIISDKVKYECVDHPLNIKKYALQALRINKLIEEKVIKVISIKNPDEANEVMSLTNKIFYSKSKPIHLIDSGETELLILAKELGIDHLLIDERTTRTLIESPETLKEHFEREFKTHIATKEVNLNKFKDDYGNIKVYRSCELLAIGYKLKYFDKFHADKKKYLEASLYNLKYNGCAISFNEIKQYLRTVD